MNEKKWLNIHNSIIRLRFYAYLETFNPDVLTEFDNHYQKFVNKEGWNPQNDKVRFFGGDMLLGLSYLILVRINEFINNELSDFEKGIALKIDNWSLFGVTTFNDLLSKYNFSIVTLHEKDKKGKYFYTNDQEKLGYFIRKLRNGLSHYNYEFPDINSIKLIDKNPSNKIIEMECIFDYSGFLNFTMDFGLIINKSLYNYYHLGY